MTYILACAVLFTAIIGFFSQEFVRLFRRIFSIRGMKLILPLLIASLVVESDVIWGGFLLSSLRTMLVSFEHTLIAVFHFPSAARFVIRVIFLTLVAVAPVCVVVIAAWKKNGSTGIQGAYWISGFFWVVSVLVLSTMVD